MADVYKVALTVARRFCQNAGPRTVNGYTADLELCQENGDDYLAFHGFGFDYHFVTIPHTWTELTRLRMKVQLASIDCHTPTSVLENTVQLRYYRAVQREYEARVNRQARDQACRDMGLVRVRGALGGTYWE